MNHEQFYGYYLCNFNAFDTNHIQTGVDRKVQSQIKAFNDSGLNCKFIFCPYPERRWKRGLGSLPGFSDETKWPDIDLLGRPSYLYIRRPIFSSKEFINFLRMFKLKNPCAKVIMEIPSYPYDNEYQSPELYFALKKDKKYRNQWKNYVDYIADLSGEKEIFSIQTLSIINGVDINSLKTRKPSFNHEGPIHFIFSAFFGPWHGCDLLLRGLSDYYDKNGDREVIIHLAGGGNLLDQIRRQIKELNLSSSVVLHGALSQGELDMLFDQCTIAVGSLGLHRRSQNCRDSSLKTREYLAKGTPFIYAGSIDVFETDPVDFCLQFPSIEQPVDFFKVIDFHDSLYKAEEETELIQRVRKYAEKHVSMDAAMANVIEILKKDKKS